MTNQYMQVVFGASKAEYVWKFPIRGKLDKANLRLHCLVPHPNGSIKQYYLQAYTEQPVPNPTMFCPYREQLYDALGLFLSKHFKTPGVTVLNVEPLFGELTYVD